MRFLADECCDFMVVRALRAAGHDVVAVSEFMNRSDDSDLLKLALETDRVLLTEDKDFGWLVYSGRAGSPGVILVRYPSRARSTLGKTVAAFVRDRAEEVAGAFIVLQPGVARIGRTP